jgi:hypothetical protein
MIKNVQFLNENKNLICILHSQTYYCTRFKKKKNLSNKEE